MLDNDSGRVRSCRGDNVFKGTVANAIPVMAIPSAVVMTCVDLEEDFWRRG